MRRVTRILIVSLAAAVSAASCTVKKTTAPEPSGPSELGISITLQAVPDVLNQDGSSQSQVSILARDGNGQVKGGVDIRVEITVGGVIADYGQLSTKTVRTGSDGHATLTYTAPPESPTAVDTETVVSLRAIPVGVGDNYNYANATSRWVDIRLVPKGVILPPNGTPTARFTASPTTPTMFTTVIFDGSSSTDSDGVIVAYAWSFGDGSSGSGQIAQHQYSASGEFVVTLTVTDDRGLSASATNKVTVGESTPPTADFVFSPTTPGLNQDIYFNGATSKAGPGRTLVRYDWHFGSGTPQSGITVVKAYDVAGTYTVTLTVTDDGGQTATAAKAVTIAAGSTTGLTASFTYSPTAPTTATTIIFDASDSYSPSGIASYEWDWGDPADPYHGGLGKTATHRYTATGTYIVRLTVTDTQGRKATTTKTLSITS